MALVSESTDERVDRLEAMCRLQAAEVFALQGVVATLGGLLLRKTGETFDTAGEFVKLRRLFVHAQLEGLERTRPGLAARLQEMLEQACKTFPVGYDDTDAS